MLPKVKTMKATFVVKVYVVSLSFRVHVFVLIVVSLPTSLPRSVPTSQLLSMWLSLKPERS